MRFRGMSGLRQDQGDSIIEFALIAFMFIMVLLSVVELGRMVVVYTTLANSARCGARWATVHGGDLGAGAATQADVATVVKNFAGHGMVNTNNLAVDVSYPNGNSAGSFVIVTVSYTYDPMVTFFNSMLGVPLGSTSKGVISY